ncbi:hypothetical protein GOP47_0018906 [Adiantum capillus-veneris]|uniref:Uncharacterized protein n=1 Tax=Adiantum capillus-veneris TaxID=13818 RepID=A0A9D4UEP1_ADICA|nr:hypothetical protein GOP47_0018906 [Adiantum capillus-veneris]
MSAQDEEALHDVDSPPIDPLDEDTKEEDKVGDDSTQKQAQLDANVEDDTHSASQGEDDDGFNDDTLDVDSGAIEKHGGEEEDEED